MHTLKLKCREQRQETSQKKNKWVWGFLSLWWIDQENRGSQKDKCKNRIVSLDTSPLFLLILSLATSPLVLSSCSLLSPVTFTALPSPPPPIMLQLFLFPPSHIQPSLPLCPFTHPCIHFTTGFALYHIVHVKALEHFAAQIPGDRRIQ